MTHVPLLDLRRTEAPLEAELVDAFRRVLGHGRYIMGPEVEAFEAACAARLGVKHALGVSSGTDAILLALMALGIGPGDEVVCPTYTFFATAGCVARVGATPRFVDVSLDDFNTTRALVEQAVGPRTRAIMPVHLFGQSADVAPIGALADRLGVPMIEDAAQSFSARCDGRAVGTLGAYGCYSFFPSKNLGALGDAGLLVTDDDKLADRARLLRTHGGRPKYHHHAIGANFRLDALQAAMLNVKLAHLDAWSDARRANAAAYREAFLASGRACENDGRDELPAPIGLPKTIRGTHVFNQFVLRLPGRRDAVRAELQRRGVETEIYYPLPMHQQPCFRAERGEPPPPLPVAERAARETLALPIFPGLTRDELAHVVASVVASVEAT